MASKERASWSAHQKRVAIDLLVEEVKNGGRPGRSLKPTSWERVIEKFFQQTGVRYDQKQFKNQWDSWRKSYEAFERVMKLNGVSFDEATQKIVVNNERWDNIIQVIPESKHFKDKPILFYEELQVLFSGTSATGSFAWGPRSPIPSDLYKSLSPSVHDLDTPNDTTPLEYIPKNGDDLEINESGSIQRKRTAASSPSTPKKEPKLVDASKDLARLCELVERIAPTTASIEECIADLNKMEDLHMLDPLYTVAVMSFTKRENRIIWMEIRDPQWRMNWLHALSCLV